MEELFLLLLGEIQITITTPLSQATCGGVWLICFLEDFQIPHPMSIIVYYDNKSTMHIVANPVFQERTKHIEIDFQVAREYMIVGTIHLMPDTTKEQVVDILTKSLHQDPFYTVQAKLGIIDIHSILREVVNYNRDNDDNVNDTHGHANVTNSQNRNNYL